MKDNFVLELLPLTWNFHYVTQHLLNEHCSLSICHTQVLPRVTPGHHLRSRWASNTLLGCGKCLLDKVRISSLSVLDNSCRPAYCHYDFMPDPTFSKQKDVRSLDRRKATYTIVTRTRYHQSTGRVTITFEKLLSTLCHTLDAVMIKLDSVTLGIESPVNGTTFPFDSALIHAVHRFICRDLAKVIFQSLLEIRYLDIFTSSDVQAESHSTRHSVCAPRSHLHNAGASQAAMLCSKPVGMQYHFGSRQ